MDQLAQSSMPLTCNAGQASLEGPQHSVSAKAQQVQSSVRFHAHKAVELYTAQ